MATVREWFQAASRRLAEAGVPSPEVDARALLEHALGLSPTGLLLRGPEQVLPDDAARLNGLLEKRAARVPLQHLLGEVEWGGVHLRSDTRALIPRPETEWLLHLSLQDLSAVSLPRVLDVGTGSGALALGLKAARPDAQVWATDISPEALTLAQENSARNGLEVTFVQGSLLAGLAGPFDLIVSNPPYLPESDRLEADPEVKHDPALALYAGTDGLELARPLAAQAAGALTPGAPLWLELDPRNATVFAAELRSTGWDTSVHPDLTGRERFVRASPVRERMPGV
ncbi:peptide chain release factor N(5)-glutamine methyltransferase [Deinococcus deserti]|uniref:Release factor glutamine methyltransferase n=1 Tax=Deinococcus deserti (strain DSM 17065 / CIP 109153 / LMG 22923 / VCD115) TaxID=546414 RepID=C1CYF5_DEIDV|nr:peptide chain release factor N(5)-glutamine methyltransferase [Deinococcus deserti]ACO44976.1 putative methyltransferase, HemK family [Deinococcus deserti VCD115]